MDSIIKGIFGGDDDDRKPQARDFISRYEQGPIDEGYSDDEAFQNFQRVSQHADPDTMQRAAEQAFSRMNPDQRAQFAQMMQQQSGGRFQGGSGDPRQMAGMVSQLHRQQPGGLGALLGGGGSGGGGGLGGMLGGALGGGGGGGFPGGTLGKVALGGIAAFAMKEMLGGKDDDDDNRNRNRNRRTV